MKDRIAIGPYPINPPDQSKMQKYNLAVLLSGQFDSYFKDKPQPAPSGKARGVITSAETIKKSLKPARIIAIGGNELTRVDNEREGKPNSVLLHNMVDYMNGNTDVPEMRSKGIELNPIKDDNLFTQILRKIFSIPLKDAAASDWAKIILKILNIIIMPAAVISVTGAVIYIKRRKFRDSIKEEFQKGKQG
jgi:hypothetical protein